MPDIAAAKKFMNWEPSVSLNDGLEKLLVV